MFQQGLCRLDNSTELLNKWVFSVSANLSLGYIWTSSPRKGWKILRFWGLWYFITCALGLGTKQMGCSAAVCLLRATGNWKEGNDWKEWIRSQGALRGQQLARSSKQSPLSSFLVCHCVSVCFFDQPISCRVVGVNYFASTPSLNILVSSKANVTFPVLQNLATRAFKDCLIASGWSNTGGGGDKHETCHETTTAVWNNPWDHCEDLCHCHTVSHPVT